SQGTFLPCGTVTHGIGVIGYGSGAPMGKSVPLVMLNKDDFPKEIHSAKWRIIPTRDRVTLPGDVLFEFDSDSLRHDARTVLRQLGILLNCRATARVVIEGHTDSIGKPEYNQGLSERRAWAVRRWLMEQKVDGANGFTVIGHGSRKPVAPNKRPDGSD